MSDVFFIGDTHFSHRGILKYEAEKRPFADVEEMNGRMIDAWNKVVSPTDKVIHLGDFCFGERNIDIAGRLNGRKILVMGNHDMYATEKYAKHFYKLVGALQFDNFICTHIPVHPDQFHRYWGNIHGHLHSKKVEGRGRYINVSCEQLPNLAPIPFDEVINRATELGKL